MFFPSGEYNFGENDVSNGIGHGRKSESILYMKFINLWTSSIESLFWLLIVWLKATQQYDIFFVFLLPIIFRCFLMYIFINRSHFSTYSQDAHDCLDSMNLLWLREMWCLWWRNSENSKNNYFFLLKEQMHSNLIT